MRPLNKLSLIRFDILSQLFVIVFVYVFRVVEIVTVILRRLSVMDVSVGLPV